MWIQYWYGLQFLHSYLSNNHNRERQSLQRAQWMNWNLIKRKGLFDIILFQQQLQMYLLLYITIVTNIVKLYVVAFKYCSNL